MPNREGRHGWRSRRPSLQQRRRGTTFGVLALVLMCALGIGIATQVRETDSDSTLDNARPADLLVILDNLNRREASVRDEIETLRTTSSTLEQSGSGSAAAVADANERLAALSIQVGTVAADGPGVDLLIEDPNTGVAADVLLDALQELRAAGAEAIQIVDGVGVAVRIGVDSWIAGPAGRVVVDGKELRAPYTFTAIGDPATLAAALNIPGGVIDTIARSGASSTVGRSDQVTVSALRDPRPRQYAQPGN